MTEYRLRLKRFYLNCTRQVLRHGLLLLLAPTMQGAEPDLSMDLTPIGKLLYITNLDGLDAIVLRSGRAEYIVFQCELESELILTPSITPWNKKLTFLVDQGAAGRTIHSLSLNESKQGRWSGSDSQVATLAGAAWPIETRDGAYMLVLPDYKDLAGAKVTGIFELRDGSIKAFSAADDTYRHFWPLLSQDGRQLLFRQLVVPQGDSTPEFWSRIILQNMENQTQQVHFVNQQVYLEQWLSQGIMVSSKLNDDANSRSYELYDPISRSSREIYRSNAWQARVTEDLKAVASIRPQPAGSSIFDIFITDLRTGVETNLTQTPRVSESIIGWLP